MTNRQKNTPDQGFALVVVIMVLLLITAIAAEMIFTVRTGIQEGRQAKQNSIGRGLAKAGVNLALFHLIDKPIDFNEDFTYIPGSKHSVYLATGKVDFQTLSESGKIDLNRINRPLFSQFLQEYGYEEDEKEIFIDSIQDWIDNDDLHRLNGAESEYYETLAQNYSPKNSPFSDPSEIFMVRGAEKLVGKLNPSDFFTIYNPSSRINFNTIGPSMLYTITSGDPERIQQYHELKEEGVLFNATHAQLILDDNYERWKPFLTYSRGKNQYYTVITTGFADLSSLDETDETVDNRKRYTGCRIRLLLKCTGNRLRYLRWSEESIVE